MSDDAEGPAWTPDQVRARLRIVEALMLAHDRWAELSAAVSGSPDLASAVEVVRTVLGVGEPEIFHVLDTPLSGRTLECREELRRERDDLLAEVARIVEK